MLIREYEIKPFSALCRANLYEANLYEANLYEANLSGANLYGADLCRANLRRANLYEANLYEANLSGANLRGANLRGANLYEANLSGANLRGANLRGANLYEANLSGANLSGANLRGADLCRANLHEADLRNTLLPPFQIPQEGSLVVYKKVDTGVIKLLVPENAKRTASLIGRKCRAEFVVVLEGSGFSERGSAYGEGSMTRPDKYNPDIRVECTHGIHFFLTREEAEEY